jgi:hypothetical protein
MEDYYHVIKDGQQIGPFSVLEIENLLQKGRFLSSDLVWKVGMSDWIAISTLFPSFTTIVPPPAPISKQPLTVVNSPVRQGVQRIREVLNGNQSAPAQSITVVQFLPS